MPGSATLNIGGGASVLSVSCASVGNCAAAGSFIDDTGRHQAFVVDETGGVWGTAIAVPGSVALNTEQAGDVGAFANSVSCRKPGNCAVGGYYETTTTGVQPFVADEKSGVWGTARKVRGNAAFNTNFEGRVNSLSCAAVGNCVAGGFYTPRHSATSHGRQTAFVVVEKGGIWGKAIDVPRIANPAWDAVQADNSCRWPAPAPAFFAPARSCSAPSSSSPPGRPAACLWETSPAGRSFRKWLR